MEDKTPIAMLILLLFFVIWAVVSADDQNLKSQLVQHAPAQPKIPKLPVLVKLNVMSGGVKIPFRVAVIDQYSGNLVEVTNESELLLENGKYYDLFIYSDGYWLEYVGLDLSLDFDCNCSVLENESWYLYKILSVRMSPIFPVFVHYFDGGLCVINPNDREIEISATYIHLNEINETKTFEVYDSLCFDFTKLGVKNITVDIPNYKLMNRLEFDRLLYR